MDRRLQELRKKIELIDEMIIDLIVERQKLAPQFVRVKKKLGLPLHQQQREKELLDRYEKIAKRKNISINLIKKIFPILFSDSLKKQSRYLEKERLK